MHGEACFKITKTKNWKLKSMGQDLIRLRDIMLVKLFFHTKAEHYKMIHLACFLLPNLVSGSSRNWNVIYNKYDEARASGSR